MTGYREDQTEKAKAAGFGGPLVRYIETDRDGHHSFNYAGECGTLKGVLDHLQDLLQQAAAARGPRQRELVKGALEYLTAHKLEHDEISRAWRLHISERRTLAKVPA